jgi:hypothetical protein
VRPNVSQTGHDSFLYVSSAQCVFTQVSGCIHDREPFYPAFLSLFLARFPTIDQAMAWVPLAQNLIFLASAFFLLACVFPKKKREERFALALAIASVPTFLIPLNGSVYTESLSASLVMLALGASVRVFGAKSMRSMVLWAGLVFCCALFLNLTKGAFPVVHCICIVLLLLTAAVARSRRISALLLAGSTLAATLASGPILKAYLGNEKLIQRGGAVFYGRTEYARTFPFRKLTFLYLVNGFSENFCRKAYGQQCDLVFFGAENIYGNALSFSGLTDEELTRRGLQNLRANPLRQLLFAPLEWSKFVFHHTSTGFAWLDLPLLGPVVHSLPFLLLLKIANLLLYGFCGWTLHRRLRPALRQGSATPFLLCLGYIAAYLVPYGFATTVVRMVYPVAPLLFVFVVWGLAPSPGKKTK